MAKSLATAIWHRDWTAPDWIMERCEYHQTRNAISYASRKKMARLRNLDAGCG